MVDATDLKSVDLNSRVGSSPTTPTFQILSQFKFYDLTHSLALKGWLLLQEGKNAICDIFVTVFVTRIFNIGLQFDTFPT